MRSFWRGLFKGITIVVGLLVLVPMTFDAPGMIAFAYPWIILTIAKIVDTHPC